jgi:hypothetical protein
MYSYYQNHPQMLRHLLKVKTIYVENVQGAKDDEESLLMKEALLGEIERKGRGRFRLAASAAEADAVLEADMKEELGPTVEDEPLPFEIEPKIMPKSHVYLRMKLTDPRTGLVIYKTDTKESAEINVDSVEKAAFTVMRNLMREVDLASQSSRM